MATIVLIHGAYQGGWVWQPTAKVLRAAGHTVYAPTLEGCAERSHQLRAGITTETHGDEIANLLFYEDIQDAVLVGTSSGGMVMAKAAELARERVGRLVFADALALQDGERIPDFVDRKTAINTDLGSGPPRSDVVGRLFKDLEEPIRTWATERYTMQPIACMRDPVELKKFWSQKWTASVIYCTNSINPPQAHQRRAADTLGASWHELVTGHYPMLSEPDALAKLIIEG